MAHPAKTISDAIKTSIAGGSFSQTITTVERVYSPRKAFEDMTTGEIKVLVAPKSLNSEGLANRNTSEETTGIDVAVLGKTDRAQSSVDDLMEVAYEVQTHVLSNESYGGFDWKPPVENDPIYDRDQLDKGLFISVTTLNFQTDRTF